MFKSKKSLGQHFLVAGNVIADIVKTADLKKDESVLEVGPGKGVLTEALLTAGVRVIAVEKDAELVKILKEKFNEEIKSGQLVLMDADILKLKTENLSCSKQGLCYLDLKLKTGQYKLVANIPYYITGEILRKFIGGEAKPSKAVLLVQKEVAERIVARDNKESILSISIKVFGESRYIKKVPAGCFNPPPKVDSAIIAVENIKNPFLSKREENRFFLLMKAGFAHKRKMLAGNLSGVLGKEKVGEILTACNIPKNARAEDLSLEDWLCLSKKFRFTENSKL